MVMSMGTVEERKKQCRALGRWASMKFPEPRQVHAVLPRQLTRIFGLLLVQSFAGKLGHLLHLPAAQHGWL